MSDCLFCKIVAREIPAEIIHEDERTLAFLDIRPTNPGHSLVIPKSHSANVYEIASEDWANVMETARLLAPAIKTAAGATGMNIIMNNDPAAGQIIFHSHVHLIPRHDDDGFRHWLGKEYEGNTKKETGEKIRNAVANDC
jgi:histidine triad (HIT) family protein